MLITDCARGVLAEAANLKGTIRPKWSFGNGCNVVGLLAPRIVPDCRLAAYLISPMERLHLETSYGQLRAQGEPVPSLVSQAHGRQVNGAPVLHLIAKTQIMRPDGDNVLTLLKPDLVICNPHSSPVIESRVRRYVETSGARAILWED